MSRLRHLYLDHAPQLAPYFILSSHDDSASVTGSLGSPHRGGRSSSSLLGMIAVINRVLVGAFVGLPASYVFTLSLPISASVGATSSGLSRPSRRCFRWMSATHDHTCARTRHSAQ
jgi:hypothetical protein